MPIERVLAIGLVVVASVMVIRSGPAAVRSWQIYAGTGRRRQEDAAGHAPDAPAGVRDRLAALAELGYRHIGETRLELPVGERFAWIMAADDADSYAILAGGTGGVALTGFYSAWSDGTWLGTIHPLGSATDRPGLQIRVVHTALADAVATHRTGLERLRVVHGRPRSVHAIADMLALDADYRRRFGGSRLLPITIRNVLPAMLAIIVLVLAVILFVVTLR
jgi:hypothetical protein